MSLLSRGWLPTCAGQLLADKRSFTLRASVRAAPAGSNGISAVAGWCALGRALRLQPLPASPPVAPTDRTARCRTLSQPLRLLSNRGRAVQRCAARCSPQSCLSRGVVLRAAASHPSPGRDRPLPLFERQCPCRGAPPLFSCQHPCALHCAATAAERQLLSNGIVPVPRVALPPRRLRRPLHALPSPVCSIPRPC